MGRFFSSKDAPVARLKCPHKQTNDQPAHGENQEKVSVRNQNGERAAQKQKKKKSQNEVNDDLRKTVVFSTQRQIQIQPLN